MHARSPNRLYHPGPLASGAPLRLDAQASHHLLRVLRLAAGDPVELFDGSGPRWPGRLLEADPRGATVLLEAPVHADTESPLAIGLAQALPAGDRMDWVVEKAVELGVTAIQPLFSRASLLKLDGDRAERRLAHWRRIAVAACMQCGRDRVPSIEPPRPIAQWLAEPPPEPAVGPSPPGATPALRLVLSPGAPGALDGLAPVPRAAWLLVGPEGGLADDELGRALAAGWVPLRLGPRVLRAETAGLAAIAALQARFGDF
jgi:16S rRNA (uracil1498-N3)-methyltransferase